MTEVFILRSDNVLLDCRRIISVNWGCLKVPGEGFASACFGSVLFTVGVLGVVPAAGVARAVTVCGDDWTRAVDVADMAVFGWKCKGTGARSIDGC